MDEENQNLDYLNSSIFPIIGGRIHLLENNFWSILYNRMPLLTLTTVGLSSASKCITGS